MVTCIRNTAGAVQYSDSNPSLLYPLYYHPSIIISN